MHTLSRILICRTDRLGDLVLALPVVEALAARWPQARIDLLADPRYAPVALMQPRVHRVIPNTFQGFRGGLALVRLLRSERYHAVIHLYPRPAFALAAFVARVPVRLGTAYRYYSLLFTHRVRVHRKHMVLHERDLNLKLIEAIGVVRGGAAVVPWHPAATGLSGRLAAPEQAVVRVRELLLRQGLSGFDCRLVVLHPGSGGSSLDWPAEHFAEIGRLLGEMGLGVVLTGTEGERTTVNRVHAGMAGKGLNLCGRLSLEDLAALLSQASLLITNSTGPLHLADALGIRVIGLYSPFLYSSPLRWGPYSQPENVFTPDRETCRGCPRGRCPEFNCMASIRPEAVLEKAKQLLAQVPPDPATAG